MTSMSDTECFFMDDEPVEDVVRAFEEGQKFVTQHPNRGRTMYLDATTHEVSEQGSRPFGELVQH